MKKTFGNACAIYLVLTVIPMAQAVIPYGEIISLKKPGGDFVTLYTLDRLKASSGSVGTNEKFLIEAVDTDNGIVALKSVGNGYYVEKEPGGTLMKTIAASSTGNTTHYYWHDVADGVVRLQNVNNGNYAQPVSDVLRVNEPSPTAATEFEWMPLTGARIADTKYSDDTPLYHIDATQPPFNAPTNGIDDATAAIQAALNDATGYMGLEESAAIVYLPAGEYLLTDTLAIPGNITLRGDWKRPTVSDKSVAGTLLLVDGSMTSQVAITLGNGAKLRQLSIYYPDQNVYNVTAYPFTVDFRGYNATVRDITLVNAYQGIRTVHKDWTSVINVYGSPLKNGLYVDESATTPRFSSLHFTPDYWAESGLDDVTNRLDVINAMRSGGINDPSIAVMTGDGDGGTSYVGFELCGYDIGLQSFDVETPRMFDFKITECRIGIDLRYTKEHGWIITQGEIDAEEIAFRTREECQHVMLNNVTFRSAGTLIEHGSGNLEAVRCTFEDWDSDNQYAVEAFQEGTNRSTRISIAGCDFLQASNHIHLNEDVDRAVVYGNTPRGDGLVINNEAVEGKWIVIDTTSYHEFAAMDPLAESVEEMLDVQRQVPRPPAGLDYVFDVSKPPYNAYGRAAASDDPAIDDTDAIQAALDDAGALASSHAGCIVYVPAGVYRIDGRLQVPSNVELRGAMDGGQCYNARSVLCLFAGKDNPAGDPIIQLAEGAGIRGFAFYRPEQPWNYDRNDSNEDWEAAYAYIATNMHAYPFAIKGTDRNWAYDLILCNIYDGIDFSTGGGHQLEFIFGTTMNDMVKLRGDGDRSVVYNLQAQTATFQQMNSSKSGFPLWKASGFGDDAPYDPWDDGGLQLIGTSVEFVGDGEFISQGHFNNKSFYNYVINGSPTLNMYLSGCEGRGIGILVNSDDGKAMDVEVVGNSYHAYEGALVTKSFTSEGDVLNLFCSKQYKDAETNHVFTGSGHLNIQQDFRIGSHAYHTYLADDTTAIMEGCVFLSRNFSIAMAADNSQAKICGLINNDSIGKDWIAYYEDSIYMEGICPTNIANITGTNGAYAPPVTLPAGLIAHWSMDDGSGSTVSDAGVYGFDATMSAASWVTGVDGGALEFDGVHSSVSLPAAAFAPVNEEVTISMWAYGGDSQPVNNSIFYAVDGSGNRVLNVHLPWSNGNVYWDAGYSGGYDRINKLASTAQYKGRWNHWVFTKNAATGTMAIYLNGSLWHSAPGKTRTMTGIASATIGSQIAGIYYEGLVDDVRLYNVSLDAIEVNDLYLSYTVTNGVPVGWLISYGIEPTDAGALADTDGDGLANWEEYAAGNDPLVSDNPPGIRVTEYYLSTGDFSGTSATLTLDQNLANDYYILVRGSRTGNALLDPDSGYARVTAVPGGKGDLPDSGAANQITLTRFVADSDWEGVVTVVECENASSPAGFKLVDAVETPLTATSGTDTSASWTDLSRVVLFGGTRGGGASFSAAASSRNQSASVFTRLTPSGSSTINWSRDTAGETQLDGVMTTFVVEWGSEWTVQHVNVAGANGGDGADATTEYTTAAISAVNRDNTWVWATGTRADAGIGDCAEACLVTLGDGVNQQASESTVAVGSEYSDAYDFDVYVLTHPAIAIDHVFVADGNSTGLDVAVAVDTAAAGTRFGWVYNGVNGTGTYHPRDIFWARYTTDGEVTISRGFDGQTFPAWVQGIDLSGLNQ